MAGQGLSGQARAYQGRLWLYFIVTRTAVHAAAFNDHVECLEILLKHRGIVNVADSQERTPLMMASTFGHSSVVGKVMYVFFLYYDISMFLVSRPSSFQCTVQPT